MASGAYVRGIQDFQRKIRNIARKYPRAVGNALWDEFDEVEKIESMARTPVDTGDLRDSHETYGPVIRMNTIRVEIRVGGGAIDYAVRVHEDTEAFHPHGQAKFLESTLREAAPHLLRRVRARLRDLGEYAN